MSELLSPAGTFEAFHSAISNGANAIYLGLDKFSARAYAENFTLDNLKECLDFAHLRNVKIYVTVNTIVYDNELKEVYETIDKLAELGVDGVIVQDVAVLHYITSNYNSLHAHASTQMGIDDIEASKLVQDMGVNRIVFARETPLSKIKDIKQKLGIEVEAFIHGALCVSYSGNCLMSSMIGERSGNRGRCAGCCRKLYTLIDLDSDRNITKSYILSMKDLNVSHEINEFSFVDSLKIEGRMKEPYYVGGVTRLYRELLDKKHVNLDDFDKVFNRTYTKGLINNTTKEDLTNIEKPNNYGYLVGTVDKQYKGKVWIKLTSKVSKGDQLRIETTDPLDKEISIPVLKMFSYERVEIFSSEKEFITYCEPYVKVGAKVYKTKDAEFINSVEENSRKLEYSKIPLDMEFTASVGKPLILVLKYLHYKIFVKSEQLVEVAATSPTSKDNVINQLSKLNDTPYCTRNISINMDENVFISLKVINELRRDSIAKLNEARLTHKVVKKNEEKIVPKQYELHSPEITVEVSNDEQYIAAKEMGIKHIYYKNIIPRNNAKYESHLDEVLVGGLGGISFYKDKCNIVSDYSLNIVNYKSVAILSSLGVDRITISEEASKEDIDNIVKDYYEEYQTYPNLELIVYGRTKLMHMQYCPLKKMGLCGRCKIGHFAIKDEVACFPLKFNSDCTVTVLNSRPLNIMDDLDDLVGVNFYRLRFTTETKEETLDIIKGFQDKLSGNPVKLFDKVKRTRGHFFNKPL